jgi:hypothetical protein
LEKNSVENERETKKKKNNERKREMVSDNHIKIPPFFASA